MLDSRRVAARVDAVRTSFETFDRDGDGVISVEDMAQVGGSCWLVWQGCAAFAWTEPGVWRMWH
jgi:hypothetical protein